MVTRSLIYFGLVILISSGSLVAAADIPWQVPASLQLAKYGYELRRSPSAAGLHTCRPIIKPARYSTSSSQPRRTQRILQGDLL